MRSRGTRKSPPSGSLTYARCFSRWILRGGLNGVGTTLEADKVVKRMSVGRGAGRWLGILLGVVVLSSALSGCTGTRARGIYFHTGEANPKLEKSINDGFKEASKARTPVDPDAKVLIDMVPEGMSFSNDVLSVDEGYAHEIKGKFKLLPLGTGSVCQVRMVIEYTLVIGLIDPSYYVMCTANTTHEGLIDEAKRMASEAGGDLVIGSYLVSNPQKSIAYGLSGWIIQMDPKLKGKPLDLRPTDMKSKDNQESI